MSGGFKRSGVFGIVGVFVVAAIVVVIATTTGQGEANPKTTMALVFGVIAVFVAILFVVEGGPDGIVVARKGGAQADWLCDLWLAERLAEI